MVRFKNRYLLLQLVWNDGKRDDTLNEGMLLQHIRDSIQINFGDFRLGSALASVQVKYFSPYTGLCVLRCGTDELTEVLCAVSLITDIKHRRLLIRSLHTAGTIQCCRAVALKYHAQAAGLLGSLPPQHRSALAAAEERLQSMEL